MAFVSQFSTPDLYQKLHEAKTKAEYAIKEAELATRAGVPNAESSLSAGKDILQRINNAINTYFPDGTVPSQTQ